MKHTLLILSVFLFSAGCTFSVASGGAGAEATSKTMGQSATNGTVVIRKYNEKGQITEEHLVQGGVNQEQQAKASSEAEATAKATNRNVSILVPIAIIGATVLVVLGGAELLKLIARLRAGTGI
jgi:hypothetical protein